MFSMPYDFFTRLLRSSHRQSLVTFSPMFAHLYFLILLLFSCPFAQLAFSPQIVQFSFLPSLSLTASLRVTVPASLPITHPSIADKMPFIHRNVFSSMDRPRQATHPSPIPREASAPYWTKHRNTGQIRYHLLICNILFLQYSLPSSEVCAKNAHTDISCNSLEENYISKMFGNNAPVYVKQHRHALL